ncbi:MAG: hypothetical protein J5U17_05215 [Candidatus Methanoperedens sp.]|nr:hypothetical protein [Candidatus Methanoperedens sp.]
MKNIEMLTIIVILVTSVFAGCVETPEKTSTPVPTTVATIAVTATATPAVTQITTPTSVPTPIRIPRVFKSLVDQDYGFKRVIEANYTPIVYENLTLNIYSGDTVIWINDADPDERLSIISEQRLWNDTSGILRWNYQEINYTFTQPGTYGVYVLEYPRLKHQKIVVSP